MRVSEFLVKWRRLFLALTVAIAAVSAFFVPKVNVIYEISFFLPDDSPVKLGLDRVQKEFPGLDIQNNTLYVMFDNLEDPGDVEKELTSYTSGMVLMGRRESGVHTLFQYLPVAGADVKAARDAIQERWGDDVIVELDTDKNMPANIVPMIVLGCILVLVILLIMCQSFMEVFLFLLSMFIAVVINMGSNAFMEGVSYMTVTMVAVLQMILSMDYSIILMNRYRQEKLQAASNDEAMARAIHGSSRSIFSSAFTTVVSLLMLMFMRVKIGPDLGFVLSKGVLFSLVCNFTVLPSFILAFDKAITATSKKIPSLPFGALARRQIKFRIPLTILFVAIIVAASILQKRTEISFSAVWETPISKIFPPQNPVVLLYDNDDELAVPSLLDTLDRDPAVVSSLSYPSLMIKGYTASEMADRFGSLSPLISEDLLRILYYAKQHPERNERLSFNELESVINEISQKGLIPEGYDTDAMMKEIESAVKAAAFVPEPKPEPKPKQEEPVRPALAPNGPVPVALADSVMVQDSSLIVVPDTVFTASTATVDTLAAEQQLQETPQEEDPYAYVTYEFATRQMTAKEVAEFTDMDRSLVNMVYRLAGRTRKPATMSPHELSSFVVNKIMSDKRYASFISAEQKAQLREVHHLLDSVFIAGPSLVAQTDIPAAQPSQEMQDSTVVSAPVDSLAVASAAPVTPVVEAPKAEEIEEEVPPTPLERLMEMYMSGRRYSAGAVYSALRNVGVKVNREDIDLVYLYAGYTRDYDETYTVSAGELVNFIYDTILPDPMYDKFIDEEVRESMDSVKGLLSDGMLALRSDSSSVALAITSYPFESPQTFEFIDRFQTLTDRSLKGDKVVMGEAVIYKEFKDGFPSELKLLTILTIAAIFIIVLITFKSFIIPILLIITVMSGVYVNVIMSGLGGSTMYFIAYLVVQSILMGATIDYSILFTTYYREERMRHGVSLSLEEAFKRAGHSIFTSGLILTLAPYAMSFMISDQMVSSILRCLAIGALAALLIILLVQPGVIAVCDRFVAPKGAVKDKP